MDLRGGRYEILQFIASGGMATVHLGRARGMGGFERLVAVKAMHPHLAEEPEFVGMFLDEARLAAQIRHPNVVGTIDVQQDAQGVFLVMEYIEGASLQQVLRALHKEKRTLPLDIALRVFLDMLAGLHAAHELTDAQGKPLHLVHRDVSPQNVLIGVDGVARITDFGVARAEARISTTHGAQLKGKIGYMSPEQVSRMPIDRRTDVYAAGVLLWELLALQRLIRGDTEVELLAKVLAGATRSPRAVNPDVPEPIDVVCMRGLEKDVDVRYATAADFAEALDDAARGIGMKIAPPRAVASFIRALNIHLPLGDLLAKSAADGQTSQLPTKIEPQAPARASISSLSDRKSAAQSASGIIVPPEEIRGKRSRTTSFAVAGVVAVALAAGAFWGFRSPRANEIAPAASSPTIASVDPPVVSSTPSATVAAVASTNAPEVPAPPATQSAPAASSSSKIGKPATSVKNPSTTPTARPSTGPVYRPPEL